MKPQKNYETSICTHLKSLLIPYLQIIHMIATTVLFTIQLTQWTFNTGENVAQEKQVLSKVPNERPTIWGRIIPSE